MSKTIHCLMVRNPAFDQRRGEYCHLDIEVWVAELSDAGAEMLGCSGRDQDSCEYYLNKLTVLHRKFGTTKYISSYSSRSRLTLKWQSDNGRGTGIGEPRLKNVLTSSGEAVTRQRNHHDWYGGDIGAANGFFQREGIKLLSKVHKAATENEFIHDCSDNPRLLVTRLRNAGFKPVLYDSEVSEYVLDPNFDLSRELPTGDLVCAIEGMSAFHELVTSCC